MKIIQVMLAKGFGGAERSFVDICKALNDKGHEVIAIVESRGKALHLVSGAKIYPIKVRSHWDPIAQWQINNILRKESPALLHAHLARAAKIGGRAAKKSGIPSLVKTHNYVNLKYYRDINCLVPTTGDQENYLLRSGISKAKVHRIPNFTALELVDRDFKGSSPEARSEPHFIAIGRLVKKKGFDILLNALKVFSDNNRFRLTIVGDGIERKNLEQMVTTLELQKEVNFVGWIDDIRPLLDAADIFVLPSVDEPFGIVVLEAMARGVPIVATKTQGPSEILDDSTAVMVNPGEVSALVYGLKQAVMDSETTLERATKALALCREKYSRSVVLDQYLGLYHKLLSNR